MRRSRTWGPTGVFPPVRNPVVLSDQDWAWAQTIFKAHMQRAAPADLRQALDNALWVFQTAKQGVQDGLIPKRRMRDFVSAPATPKQIRGNLKRARQAALRLNDRLSDLDGNSRQLIGEVRSDGVQMIESIVETQCRLSRQFQIATN